MATNRQRRILADLEPIIRRLGWAALAVGGDGESAPFIYTIGLAARGLPELIVAGHLEPEKSQALLKLAVDILLTVGELPLGVDVDQILRGYPVRFYKVDPHQVQERLTIAVARQNGHDVAALQMVLPDSERRFPGEPGFAINDQPLLFTGSN